MRKIIARAVWHTAYPAYPDEETIRQQEIQFDLEDDSGGCFLVCTRKYEKRLWQELRKLEGYAED